MQEKAHRELFDVVVVGGGGAGLAAAIEARRSGRQVVLIEKSDRLGGSTALSVGSVTASLTPHQLLKGIKDSPQDHWRDMALFNGPLDSRDNPTLRQVLAEEIPNTFRWLLAHGVRFYGPMPELPHTKPRMHNVLPNSRSFITHLERAARRAGVDIRVATRAVALVQTDGRVSGVDCEYADKTVRFIARGGVVLAAGDFTNDPDLKARYMGATAAKVEGVNAAATGDGQKLGITVGARIVNGDLALGPELRFIAPARPSVLLRLPPWQVLAKFMGWSLDHMPSALLRPFVMQFVTTALAPSPNLFTAGAILVNKAGQRFCDETDMPAHAMPDQLDKQGFILIDPRIVRQFSAWPHFVSTAPGVAYAYIEDYRRNRKDIFHSAPTLENLAVTLGMPAGSLADTVARYNADAGNRRMLGDGPYVALGPVRAVFVHSEGGLAVDHNHAVLDGEGRPIAGLFAAGSTGQGGLLLKGHGHHLAWAFTSGRRAGRNAAHAAVAIAP